MTDVNFEVKGLKELLANMRYFSTQLRGRVVRGALAASLTPARKGIRDATYTTVTRRTGLLRAGLRMRNIRGRQTPGIVAAGVFAARPPKGALGKLKATGSLRSVAVRKKGFVAAAKKKDIVEPFYWRFIEFGTARMTARPYIAKAFGDSASAVLERFKVKLAAGIEKAAQSRPNK
jgi:HK97 gp10 family phage protein